MHQPVGPPYSPTLAQRLAEASSVAVLTGAGISAESGVPTFRDPDGLWQQFRPEELANMGAFLANPTLVQGWYAHRRQVVEDVQPNPGHTALAELERLVGARGGSFHLATQNVDGLHQRAGSERVVELHGSLLRSYCAECERTASGEEIGAIARGEAARCPACGGLVRPDVVWFGEMLPEDALREAEHAALSRRCVPLHRHERGRLPGRRVASGGGRQRRVRGRGQPRAQRARARAGRVGPRARGEVLPLLVDAVRAALGA